MKEGQRDEKGTEIRRMEAGKGVGREQDARMRESENAAISKKEGKKVGE